MAEHEEEQTQETSAMKQVRKALERAQAGESRWKTLALKGLAERAGLDPKAKVTGLLIKEFEGTIDDDTELDVEAFKTFAVEYGVTPAAPQENEEEEETGDQSDQLNRFQQETDALGREVSTDTPDQLTPEEQAARQLAAGDVFGSIATKFSALQAQSTEE